MMCKWNVLRGILHTTEKLEENFLRDRAASDLITRFDRQVTDHMTTQITEGPQG